MAKAKKARRKAKQAPPIAVSYLFEIVQSDPEYSIGTNTDQRFSRGPYQEFLHHHIQTTCLKPDKFAGRKTTILLLGERNMLDQRGEPPLSIGTLTMRGDYSQFLGSFPFDTLLALPSLILLGGYKYIRMHGGPTKYGSASIRSIGFQREYEPDDF